MFEHILKARRSNTADSHPTHSHAELFILYRDGLWDLYLNFKSGKHYWEREREEKLRWEMTFLVA